MERARRWLQRKQVQIILEVPLGFLANGLLCDDLVVNGLLPHDLVVSPSSAFQLLVLVLSSSLPPSLFLLKDMD